MKHNTEGLSRPCNQWDLFISGNGLQCGNCLAYEGPKPTAAPTLAELEAERAAIIAECDKFTGYKIVPEHAKLLARLLKLNTAIHQIETTTRKD